MDVDSEGNLYVAVRDATSPGVYVYEPGGRLLARIPTGRELPTNVGWGRGADGGTLYVTSGISLYRLRLNARGFERRVSR
jgi:sugar lactone lactonase YvrE